MSTSKFSLPSTLPSKIALQDVTTAPDKLQSSLARVTSPAETPLWICGVPDCHRLFPSRERIMQHRKQNHGSEEDRDIITWNDPPAAEPATA
ncbi:hypothetical protein FIBSPDRAFT_945185 [Athelia psychrophila]|uniref:C2H2-type domain-containing protein n=1 Tax=Athelia psychrophila TaxID=1759441 RepID=A0A166TZB3_9AGAM|nr:hypothetical protein FIBSPDRAFT_945185 [Fibularhizoctonia sp. CBS 109695]